MADSSKLARLIRDLIRNSDGQARTRQISRSSVELVNYTGDEDGNVEAETIDVPVSDLLASVPETADTVAEHDENISLLDEVSDQTIVDVVDVQEWGDATSDEAHDVQQGQIELWEYAGDIDDAHQVLVDTTDEIDKRLTTAAGHIEEAGTRLESAEQRLDASATLIASTKQTADAALLSASKKNRILSGLDAPPAGYAGAIGDRYEKRNEDGALLESWAWEGDPAEWVQVPLSETYLPLVNIGDGTYGELVGDRLQAKSVGAEQIIAETIAALTAELQEAFIRSGHIIDLDVSRLVVTKGAEMPEAVIERLWADVVKANLLVATEGIIAGSAVIDGTLLAKHMATEFFEGQHLKGTLIEGGQFIGATYELQATDDWSTIYNPGNVTSDTLGDFHGGSPSSVAAATLSAGAARVSTSGAGRVVGYWRNNGYVTPAGTAARRVSIRIRSSQALTGVHIMIGDKLVNGPAIAANTWTTLRVSLNPGDKVEWIHVSGIAGAATTLDMNTVTVETAALSGAKLTVTHVDGVPGLRVETAAGATILDLSPLGLVSSSTDGSEKARLQHGRLEFIGPGVHPITSPGGLKLDGPVSYGNDTDWVALPLSSGIVVHSSLTPMWRVHRGKFLIKGAVKPSSGNFTTSSRQVIPDGGIPNFPGVRGDSWDSARVLPSGGGAPVGRSCFGTAGGMFIAATSGTPSYFILNSEYDIEDT